MTISRVYLTKDDSLTAVVLEDGKYTNFIYDPELVAMDEGGIIEEAKYGFPSALSYEDDISEGDSTEKMAKLQERESTLILEVGENIVIYPQRMSEYSKNMFELELGEELWSEIEQKVNGDEGVQIDI
jgi:hypothetical protein